MISLKNLTFIYPGAHQPVLRNINLEIHKGSFTLLTGPSGSGKSTLLRCVNGLVPHFSGGKLCGEISVSGMDPVVCSPKVMSRTVGFVFQDPETQFIVDKVEDEIAFTLENTGMAPETMQVQVTKILDLLTLTGVKDRRIDSLSGGEQQRVAIGTALALEPQILLLDEPTSQLDPASAQEVLLALTRLNKSLGITILISEHRIERLLSYVDHLVHLEQHTGAVISGKPREVIGRTNISPSVTKLGIALDIKPPPLSIGERDSIYQAVKIRKHGRAADQKFPESMDPEKIIEIKDLQVTLGKVKVLDRVDLNIRKGETLVLMGPNGAGKTTLLRTIAGFIRQDSGSILLHGDTTSAMNVAQICRQVGYLPQNPNSLLFSDSVAEELLVTLKNHNPDMDDTAERRAKIEVLRALVRIGLERQKDAYPRDLSVGQRQRVAIGAVTITSPGILMLDEPTRGLDYDAKDSLVQILGKWRDSGMGILVVTHDVELAALAADRVAILERGKITSSGSPSKILRQSETFQPQIAKLFPETEWLTVKDALDGLEKI